MAAERLHPFGLRARREDRVERHDGRRGVATRRPVVGLQVGPADDVADLVPELRLERADRHVPAVGRAVDPVARLPAGKQVAAARPHLPFERDGRQRLHVMREHAFAHRDVDVASDARALRIEQRRENAHRRNDGAAEDVRHLEVRDHGVAVGRTDLLGQAGEAVVVQVVAGEIAIRTGLAVARDRAVDDGRIHGLHGFVADPEPVDDAGTEALDHDVRRPREFEEQLDAIGLLEVQRHAALVAIDREEHRRDRAFGRAERAGVVARAGVLDLDDVGAEIGEVQRAHRTGQQAREVQDAHAGERFRDHQTASPDWSPVCHAGQRFFTSAPSDEYMWQESISPGRLPSLPAGFAFSRAP